MGLQEGPQKEGVLGDKGVKQVRLQCAITESHHERMREARPRQVEV
jgi:hypothetical protein